MIYMTTTTSLLFNSYTVQTTEPTNRLGGICGEYVLTGKRGATYRTWRRNDEQHVQFIAESGKFCAIAGNYHLSLALIAGLAVTLTDADRIA